MQVRHAHSSIFLLADTHYLRRGFLIEFLGDLLCRQGREDESFDAYLQAIENFTITMGKEHRNTGQVSVKLAWHYAKVGEMGAARYLVILILSVAPALTYFVPVIP